MTRLRWLVLLSVLVLCADPAHGCQYNVREVGFIDVGIEPYSLFVYVPQTVPSDEVDGFKDAFEAAFADANVRCELILPGADANHPGHPEVQGWDALATNPAVVLMSPDGPSRRLALPAGGQSLAEAVSSSLEAVLDSPTRRQILEKAVESYAVVLLIEGPQTERNTAARQAVSTAISHVTGQLEYLPKPIAKGPEMVVLDRSSLAREEVLLWTLGLKPQDVNEPCAAVFYGRGRWIGPLFKGAMLTEGNLMQILPVIGADCECGLDHRWLQGTMLPVRWDERLQQKVTAGLGFDPESPLVKMEMVSIIRRGMGGFHSPGVPLGYRRTDVGAEPALLAAPSAAETSDTPAESETGPAAAVPASQAAASTMNPRTRGVFLAGWLAVMIVVVAATSAVVLLRAKKD